MAFSAGGRERRKRSVAVLDGLGLAISGRARSVLPVRLMVGFQASLLLLLLVGCAIPDWQGSSQHDIVSAHPEWPPEILGAVASGVISAGMTSDMVRAAWGHPTRLSSDGSGSSQRDRWHYGRRQHAAEMIGGHAAEAQPSVEWTVSFVHGLVVGWTD
jgi:hypothetical protein